MTRGRKVGFRFMPIEDRFMTHVNITPECWIWTGCLDKDGYGKFKFVKFRVLRTHVAAYELFVGPVPDGMQIHHKCENTSCVNPGHLNPVTPKQHKAFHPTPIEACSKAGRIGCANRWAAYRLKINEKP